MHTLAWLSGALIVMVSALLGLPSKSKSTLLSAGELEKLNPEIFTRSLRELTSLAEHAAKLPKQLD